MWKLQAASAKGKFPYVSPSGAGLWPQNLNPMHDHSRQNMTRCGEHCDQTPAPPFSSSSLGCSSKTSKTTQSQYNGNWIWASGDQPTRVLGWVYALGWVYEVSIKASMEAKKFNNDSNSRYQGNKMSTYYAPSPVLSSPYCALPYFMIRALWCEY